MMMAAGPQIANDFESAHEESAQVVMECGCKHVLGSGGDNLCLHDSQLQQPQEAAAAVVSRYGREQMLALNPAHNGAVVFPAALELDPRVLAILGELAIGEDAVQEDMDMEADLLEDSSVANEVFSNTTTEATSEGEEEKSAASHNSNVKALFTTRLSVRPVAIPVVDKAGRIPILPICVFENILKFKVDGDGFDIFRSPFPDVLVKVPDEFEEFLQLKPSVGASTAPRTPRKSKSKSKSANGESAKGKGRRKRTRNEVGEAKARKSIDKEADAAAADAQSPDKPSKSKKQRKNRRGRRRARGKGGKQETAVETS